MTYDLDSYPEPPTAPVAIAGDPEKGGLRPGHIYTVAEEPSPVHHNDKEDTKMSGIRIVEIILAIAVVIVIAVGLIREFSTGGDEVAAIPPAELERAFDFAPTAPNPKCEFPNAVSISNANGDERLKFRAVRDEEEKTITIQAEREGNGWIGIAITETPGMIPNTAVVGTPVDGVTALYQLNGKNPGAINNLGNGPLQEATTLQDDDRTILSFTLGLDENLASSVTPGQPTRIMWAIGKEGDDSFQRAHAPNSRGFATIDIASCDLGGAEEEVDVVGVNASPFDFAPDAPVAECAFPDDFVTINNDDGEERLKFRAIVNEQDETVTIQAERQGQGWIGLSINDSTKMVPNEAVIGTPADGQVQLYDLGGKQRPAITLQNSQEPLSAATTLEQDDRTIISYTLPLTNGATTVSAQPTRIMWAIGKEGDTTFTGAHAFGDRGFATIELSSCNIGGNNEAVQVDPLPFDFAPEAPLAECAFQDDFVTINNLDGDERLKFRAIVNERDETVTIQAERQGQGWIGLSINDSADMVPNDAVIGTPSDGQVQLYNLGGKQRTAVALLENQGSLSDATTLQKDDRTILSYTLPLAGGATTIAAEPTRIMWAIGKEGDTDFSGAHAFGDGRGFATIVLPSCGLAPPTDAPTTSSPTASPTASPTQSPVTPEIEEEEEANDETIVFEFGGDGGAGELEVQVFESQAKVYSKTGNRRSCQADVCPGTWWNLSQDGCSCSSDGLNTCYENGDPVSLESYNTIRYTETWTGSGKYTMSASAGKATEFGAGGDSASASPCYDDWRRGGFKIDLSGTAWAFHGDSTIWVRGYSPSMKIWADNQVVELHEYNQDTTLSWKVPRGVRTVEVVCGGWPANCWSDLSAFKPTTW